MALKILLTTCLVISSSSALASLRSEIKLKNLLEDFDFSQQQAYYSSKQLEVGPSYEYLKSAKENLDKNIRLTLHYLTKAEKNAPKNLTHLINYYRAKALMSVGDYVKAVDRLKSLIRHSSFSEGRKYEIKSLLLDAFLELGQNNEFLQFFSRFKGHSRFDFTLDEYYLKAASLLEERGDYSTMYQYLERLVEFYPISKLSRRAFIKLNEYACESVEKKNIPRYYFSYKLLTKLGRHVSLDQSLKDFILFSSQRLLRKKRRKAQYLSELERVDFLFDARLYKNAFELGQQISRDKYFSFEKDEKAKLLTLLGILANRLYKHKEAAKYFSLTKSETIGRANRTKLSEYLADSLSYGGFKSMASDLYGHIAEKTNNRLLRWHHFWNRYSISDWEQASLLLKRSRTKYVPPRDYLQPHGPLYWRARVLENSNDIKQAEDLYKKLLETHSDDIYGNFIAFRHPQLIASKSNREKNFQNIHQVEQETWVQGKSLSLLGNDFKYKEKINNLIQLFRIKMYTDVADGLKTLNLSKLSLEELAIVSALSKYVGAYYVEQKSARKYILKLIPNAVNWYQITKHQDNLNMIWKSYYPKAYETLVFKVADVLTIDPFFILSIMRMESYYNEKSLSYVGARGLMQIMPYTALQIAKRIGHDDFELDAMWNPKVNIVYGGWYLSFLLEYYHDNPILAAAAYNAGPFAVNAWVERCDGCEFDEFIESIPYRETRGYVKNVVKSLVRYHRIYASERLPNLFTSIPRKLPPNEEFF